MTLYYRASDPSDLRDLGTQVEEWLSSGNPKAADWIAAPPRPSDEATWADGAWQLPPPPPPDWDRFKASLLTDAAANAALAAAMPSAPGAVLALPAALMALAAGQSPSDFHAAWGALRQADLIPAALLAAIVALAQECALPAAFVAALARPFPQFVGQEWIDPDGSLWRVVQPRGEDGQFLPDDPATPERESLAWQRIG